MEDGALLILASVSQLDNGEYVCTAANKVATTKKQYQLKVNVPPDLHDNESPGNVSVVLNQTTNLVCDVTGSPAPIITWYKDCFPVGEPGRKRQSERFYSAQNLSTKNKPMN
ncbi:neural cell adhesion molecule 1-like [Salvelinus sp. IW2-2015]|uniref:neural cell adhesion molecule 1-like n=1 Tax=Salvelinus sp. IW2-2015 TaxID=2691554 RepID=UPI0038D35565